MIAPACWGGLGIGALAVVVFLWGKDRYIAGQENPDETKQRRLWWCTIAIAGLVGGLAMCIAFPGR